MFKTYQNYLEQFLEHSSVRKLRKLFLTARWDLSLAVIFYFVSTTGLLAGILVVAEHELPSIMVYNGIHILANILGHLFLVSVFGLCAVMHKVIMAVQLGVTGVNVSEVDGSAFLKSPGSYFRIFLVLLAVGIDIVLAVGTFNFEFVEAMNLISTDACIPSTYESFKPPIQHLGSFLQGDVDPSLITFYCLPLADGCIGGWSSWPLISPAPKFSLESDGIIFLENVSCFEEVSATAAFAGTKIGLVDSDVFGNFIEGRVEIYMPTGSVQSPMDHGLGVNQICSFAIGFGTGRVEYSFISDEWDMVAFNEINEIEIP
ncbi:hypothetical protein HDU91_002534, partial [Kappamyces sp. JEL0680]